MCQGCAGCVGDVHERERVLRMDARACVHDAGWCATNVCIAVGVRHGVLSLYCIAHINLAHAVTAGFATCEDADGDGGDAVGRAAGPSGE